MTSEIQEQILKEFSGLFDGTGGAPESLAGSEGGDMAEEFTGITAELDQTVAGGDGSTVEAAAAGEKAGSDVTGAQGLQQTVQALASLSSTSQFPAAETVEGSNTRGGQGSTAGGDSAAATAGSLATTFLESGFGIVPLISGLIGLFSGGPEVQPALEKYAMPSAISFESSETSGGLTAADFDQTGAPRAYTPISTAADPENANSPTPASTPASQTGTTGPQISVNVQAMDARSFMDYSAQIAQAVRSAMLNLSSLNDVVSEL